MPDDLCIKLDSTDSLDLHHVAWCGAHPEHWVWLSAYPTDEHMLAMARAECEQRVQEGAKVGTNGGNGGALVCRDG